MNIEELRARVTADFSKAWGLNDPGHREGHFREVETTGLIIRDTLGLDFTNEEIFFAAYFHDLFSWSRDNHHELSGRWITTSGYEPLRILDNERNSRWNVAHGCYCHRASFKGMFNCAFAEFFNAADRCRPQSVSAMLDRAIAFRTHRFPEMAHHEIVADAIKHLKEKYGNQGYARYPAMYLEVFGDQLRSIREEIDSLDPPNFSIQK